MRYRKPFVNYYAYLQSPQWRAVRAKRLQIDGFRCHICGARKNLEVHHRSYERLAAKNEIYDLITLCHDCHMMMHDIKPKEEFDVVSDADLADFVFLKETAQNNNSTCPSDNVKQSKGRL